MIKQKVQVVILAGGSGQFLYPLCEKFPKCLLPISDKPAIAFQLELLEQHGFTDVFIVTTKLNNKIKSYISQEYKGKIKPEFINVSEELESAEALSKIYDKINDDFLLMSCDVITDLNICDLLDFHHKNNATMTVVMKREDLESGKKMGKAPISCNLTENYDICLINPDNSELVFIVNSDDLEEGEFPVKRSILLQHPKLELMSNVFDTHIYVCKKIILNLIHEFLKLEDVSVHNFKEEFLPFLVSNQYNHDFMELMKKIDQQITKPDLLNNIFANRRVPSSKLKVQCYIQSNFYCRRISNLKDYKQCNLDSLVRGEKGALCFTPTANNIQIQSYTLNQQSSPTKKISRDSYIGEGSDLKDKITVTRSIIGKNCVIEENVKITNSIIMRDVFINSGSIISDCILSNSTHVQSNVVLEHCFSGPSSIIEGGTKNVNETFFHHEQKID